MFAAIDLGSNSFHLFIADFSDGKFVQHAKYSKQLRLAAHLDQNNYLSDEGLVAAFETIAEFKQQIDDYFCKGVVAVATHALRVAKNSQLLIDKVANELDVRIDIISGEREAELVYRGVRAYSAIDKPSLLIDIGGGSTEFALGDGGLNASSLFSFTVGCVSLYTQFFPDFAYSEAQFQRAMSHIRKTIHLSKKDILTASGMPTIIGTSGTIKALVLVLEAGFLGDQPADKILNRNNLERMIKLLIQGDGLPRAKQLGLQQRRLPILLPGACLLLGILEQLDADAINYVPAALREGLIFELSQGLSA